MMRDIYILLSPIALSVKNDIVRLRWSFYQKALLYLASGCVFLIAITSLLSLGMSKLQHLSPDIFNALMVKAYSFVFGIVFFMQIVSSFFISLDTFYTAKDLEVLVTSPVNRISLFFSRAFLTHIRASWMLVIFGIPLLVSPGVLFHSGIVYYLSAIVLYAVFSVIPVNIGIGSALLAATIFQTVRLKKILYAAGLIAVMLFVVLLRVLRPEQFVNPELFATLALFVSELKTPSHILLPSRWMSESLFSFMNWTTGGGTFLFIALLFLTSYVTTVFIFMIFRRFHFTGWRRVQEAPATYGWKRARLRDMHQSSKKGTALPGLGVMLGILGPQSSAIVRRDALYQVRDIRNVNQALVLLPLMIVYLFSVAALPLNWDLYAVRLKYVVSFLNLGLILIILAAFCSRIVYPAVTAEGMHLWIVRTSPLTTQRYIITKFFFFFIPIAILGQFLAIGSSLLIGIESRLVALSGITVLVLTSSLVSMSLAFGLRDLKPTVGDTSLEQGRTGSAFLMVASLLLVLFTLAMEIVPFYLYLLKEANQLLFTQKAWLIIVGVLAGVFMVNVATIMISFRLGKKRVDRLQFM